MFYVLLWNSCQAIAPLLRTILNPTPQRPISDNRVDLVTKKLNTFVTQTKTINSILEYGVMSSQDLAYKKILSIKSADMTPSAVICVNYINDFDGIQALMDNPAKGFPILFERFARIDLFTQCSESDALEKLSDCLNSSVLVVISKGRCEKGLLTMEIRNNKPGIEKMEFDNEDIFGGDGCYEKTVKNTIFSPNFSYVIIPEKFKGHINEDKLPTSKTGKCKIIYVESSRKELLYTTQIWKGNSRKIEYRKVEVQCPKYGESLKEIFEKQPQGIITHLVRLTTQDDEKEI